MKKTSTLVFLGCFVLAIGVIAVLKVRPRAFHSLERTGIKPNRSVTFFADYHLSHHFQYNVFVYA